MWRQLANFLSTETQARIKVFGGPQEHLPELLARIASSQLPALFGGTATLGSTGDGEAEAGAGAAEAVAKTVASAGRGFSSSSLSVDFAVTKKLRTTAAAAAAATTTTTTTTTTNNGISAELQGQISEELYVGPGETVDVSFTLRKNDKLAWEFSTAQFDIAFGAHFADADREVGGEADDVEVGKNEAKGDVDGLVPAASWLFPLARRDSNENAVKGAFEAGRPGNLTLVFDNAYSYWNAKTVALTVSR